MRIRLKTAAAIWFLVAVSAAAQTAKPSFLAGERWNVCMDPSFAPMEFIETAGQEPVGFDVDLTNLLAKDWNVKPNIVSMEFSGLLPGLDSGRCDTLITGLLMKPDRVKVFGGIAYLKTQIVMMGMKKTEDTYESYGDFSGQVVAVEAGTSYVDTMNQANEELAKEGKPKIIVQTYPKQAEALQQVSIGRAVAFVTQDTEFAYRDLQTPDTYRILYTAPEFSQFGIFIRKSPADEALIKESLGKLKASGELKKLAEKWKIPDGALNTE
jgi:polar amino acid transport system substrate-binding protein